MLLSELCPICGKINFSEYIHCKDCTKNLKESEDQFIDYEMEELTESVQHHKQPCMCKVCQVL